MNNENIKGIIDLKDVDTDLRSHIEGLERKLTEGNVSFIDFLKYLHEKRPYVDPTEHMSQKRKEQFNSYIAESIKKAKEDGY